MLLLDQYIRAFKKLKRAHNYGGAPHKPILLLAILEGVFRQEIQSEKISITPELILCFKEYWNKMVRTPHHMNFALPFFHLNTEGFWTLVCKPGYSIPLTSSKSIKSLKALNEALLWAEIDKTLFMLMQNRETNRALQGALLNQYFPKSPHIHIKYGDFHALEDAILHETHDKYSSNLKNTLQDMRPEQIEEELFVRGSLFKREIPKQYNYSCAITRSRIVTSNQVQMVDACHIVPFSQSNDDTIRNGISLSPTMHRAFDRGLITLSNDYKVMVSNLVQEESEPWFLINYQHKPILLPTNSAYRPAIENITWHRENVFLR
ncbi:MAG: hypothetical protein RLZZ262_1568 [Bacteroidota bacterium]|jgi:putative restriction endonuclease